MTIPSFPAQAGAPYRTSAIITAYDYIKVLAVILMMCDHIGAFLFPHVEILRVLGRLCVPIWLFLIGYARSRTIDDRLILCAISVSAMTYVCYGYVEPLNILWTIIIVRILLKGTIAWISQDLTHLAFATTIFFALTPFTRMFFEYGTIAFIFAIWGHITRNGFSIYSARWSGQAYGFIAMTTYLLIEQIAFDFDLSLLPFLIIGSIFVYCLLTLYFPRNRIGWMPFSLNTQKTLSWIGHNTLYIYVGHLAVIFIIALFFYPCLIADVCIPRLVKDGIDLTVLLP